MNKNDLVDAVAAGTGISKSDGTHAVDAMLDSISGALKDGDEVRLPGFGTFSVAQRKASKSPFQNSVGGLLCRHEMLKERLPWRLTM